VPGLRAASGTLAVELVNGRSRRRWLVDVRKGDVAVRRGSGEADCTLRAGEEAFGKIISGRSSPVTAALRGEVEIDGDPRLLVLFRRLLPGPKPKPSRKKARK
jgi:putative sterol carrier protein